MTATVAIVEMTDEELDELLARIQGEVEPEDYQKLTAIVGSLRYLTQLIGDDKTTLRRLRALFLHRTSEKTRKLFGDGQDANAGPATEDSAEAPTEVTEPPKPAAGADAPPPPSGSAPKPAPEAKPKPKGHGRNGVSSYGQAERVPVAHATLTSGAPCPLCEKGRVYRKREPARLVRIIGQAPFRAKIYEQERLRCNLCGDTFTAEPPPGVGPEKYDSSAATQIGLLKYGTGMPFYRLERMQASTALPLPDSTQWDIVADAGSWLVFARDELIREAAQGQVIYNDDTFMRILTLMKENQKLDPKKDRTGIFTTGIVSVGADHRVALFFTGRQHAGENFADVLRHRAEGLGPPIQMCDGLDRNLPGELAVILGNCLAHARRYYVDAAENFPLECRHVLEQLAIVYRVDETAREARLDAEARLGLHQKESAPVMERLRGWLEAKIANREVEPSSGLGRAISYSLKRWDRLTLFLRQAGAPLDSNIVERCLKKAILNRKNAMFYRTENGARVGDTWMSLIYTCELNRVDPRHYLTALLDHRRELQANPSAWMPWNYLQALDTG
jgi:transposase